MPEPDDKDLIPIGDSAPGERTPGASAGDGSLSPLPVDSEGTRISPGRDEEKPHLADPAPANGTKIEAEDGGADHTRIAEKPDAGPRESETHFPDSADVSGVDPPQNDSKIGRVLNGLWEVRRLIARGGMGEVYEGVDNLKNKVAIKFLLPTYAANQNIRTMFRDEAHVLQDLSKLNSTLVQYRACYDPKEGEPYIVMEYVEGPTLWEAIPSLKPNVAQLIEFARLLASALAIAHKANLIHRDLSPKNIMLSGGELLGAKIIDFGIAKNLAAKEGTRIEGFKGNLQYSSPEQFDEGGRWQVGPWTDVYSLALVLAAVARGKPVSMGNTEWEAVQKRQTVPNLAGIPRKLRPVLDAMLQPDPAKRLRSMAEVLRALKQITRPPIWRIAIAASALLLIGGFTVHSYLFGDVRPEVRATIVSSLERSDCTWLDLNSVTRNWGTVRGKLSGFAGDVLPVTNGAVVAAGIPLAFDTAEVSTVARQACEPLNAFRRFRESSPSLTAQQTRFAVGNDAANCPPSDNVRRARVSIDLKLEDASTDFALLGFETNGWMQVIIPDRQAFEKGRERPEFARSLGDGVYRFSFCVDEKTASRTNPNGVVGLVLVKGNGPFNLGLDPKAADTLGFDPAAADTMPAPSGWANRFNDQAEKQGWRTQIAWYQVVTQ